MTPGEQRAHIHAIEDELASLIFTAAHMRIVSQDDALALDRSELSHALDAARSQPRCPALLGEAVHAALLFGRTRCNDSI